MSFSDHKSTEDFYHCDLWDWAVDKIVDPLLADKFEWDACRLFKFNGSQFVCFIHEPWTADQFWDVQVWLLIAVLYLYL